MYIGVQNVNLRFYHLPCRFFEFATGGIVFLYQSKIKQKVAPIVGYLSYLLLLLILIFDIQLIPSNIKLLFVVGVTAILLMSFESLENGKIKIITSNKWLGVIGAASFSVYVWHQIVFAFVRYSFTSDFSLSIFVGIILLVSVLSSLSYIFIEKTVSRIYNNKKRELSIIVILVWIISTGMAGLIYLKAGVVRDVPELDIYAQDTKRNMHSVYNESASQYAGKQFSTNKSHWLILGNSFAKDWANVIMESEIKDNVELSIDSPDDVFKPSLQSRIKNADRVFISMLHVDEDIVDKVLSACILNGLKEDQLFIVGEKDFGQSTGQIYWKRGSSNYYKLTTLMDAGFYDKNEKLKLLYKEQFVDLIGMVLQEDGKVLVFTNNGKYISQDTAHLTKNGAKYYAEIIDWRRFFDK